MTTQTATITDPVEPQPGAETFPPENFAQELLARILPGASTRSTPSKKSDRSDPSDPSDPPTHTTLGSPCAKSWDAPWIAQVEAAEQRLQRRICGARTHNGVPCELESNHANGRCKFHGGFALTGAAPGNRNAVIHGLYSRRLRTCSDGCPMWDRCPCAGADVKALKPIQRPLCAYEQMEYDTALTDALARAAKSFRPDPLYLHIAHSFAAIQVLFNRALKAIAINGMTDTVDIIRESTDDKGGGYTHSTKLGAYLQAFTKIAAEYRRFAAMLEPKQATDPNIASAISHAARCVADTNPDPDVHELLHADAGTALNNTDREVREALEHAAQGDSAAATASFQRAAKLAQQFYVRGKVPDAGTGNPDPWEMPKEAVELLHHHITGFNLPIPKPAQVTDTPRRATFLTPPG